MTKNLKVENLNSKIKHAINEGLLRYSSHARERMMQRNTIGHEVEYVLINGVHEKKKDTFNVTHSSWDYAI